MCALFFSEKSTGSPKKLVCALDLPSPEKGRRALLCLAFLGLQLEQQWDIGWPQGLMAPGFGSGSFTFGEQPPPQRRIKEWSPIDRMLAEKGSKRRSKTELPPLSPPPPPPVTTAEVQVQTESWEVLLQEAVAAALVPEHEKYKALQAEIRAMQQQLKEKDEEIERGKRETDRCKREIESCKREIESCKRSAAEAAAEAQNAHTAELTQYLEEKKSLDDFKRLVEKQRLQWTQERDALEASQNLLRAELQSARTEASDERWQKEEMEKDLSSQLEAARKARADCREEMDALQDQLRRSQDDMKSLQKQMAALKEEHRAVAKERDDLLQRLEDEQAEMIARVAAMEEQLSKRGR
eukprot:s1365_g16.t1